MLFQLIWCSEVSKNIYCSKLKNDNYKMFARFDYIWKIHCTIVDWSCIFDVDFYCLCFSYCFPGSCWLLCCCCVVIIIFKKNGVTVPLFFMWYECNLTFFCFFLIIYNSQGIEPWWGVGPATCLGYRPTNIYSSIYPRFLQYIHVLCNICMFFMQVF